MLVIASIITVAFAGSVVVTPLYPLFQREFGFSEVTLTLIYAVYVVGNVAALLLFGQLSDQIGRKRVALPALMLAALGGLLFVLAHGTAFLFAARLLVGLAVGIASGTGTAWLADEFGPERRSSATVWAATANMSGIALGPLLGGLLGQYAPWPLVLPFLVYIAFVLAIAFAIWRMPTGPTQTGKLREVRVHPRIGVPRSLLGAFAAPAATGFVIFALGGLYFALIPGILIKDLHITDIAVGGFVVFELGAIAAAGIVIGRRLSPKVAMTCGQLLLLPGVGLVVAAQALASLALLLVAAGFAGLTMALGYRGSLQVINEIAPDQRRAEVTSAYFIACFAGNSLPVIGLGVLSTVTGALTASIVFACTIAALSVASITWQRRLTRP
jgi:MFS family permease